MDNKIDMVFWSFIVGVILIALYIKNDSYLEQKNICEKLGGVYISSEKICIQKEFIVNIKPK